MSVSILKVSVEVVSALGDIWRVTDQKKHPKRRIGADEAHSWARNLRLHNSLAKLVLSMTTLYVDGDGFCRVGIKSLAEDTELSDETVRRRLAWLESIGAIARMPMWLDENGRRNPDGRGKRTTDEIRLLLDADSDAIEARALGATEDEIQAEASISPVPQTGLTDESAHASDTDDSASSDSKNLSSPPVSPLAAPTLRRGAESLEPEPEGNPPTPQAGGEGPALEGWEEFKTAFEADGHPILKVSLGKTLFASMTTDERAMATRAAKGLIAIRSRERKPGTKPAVQIFLREREAWASFAKQAPPDPVKRCTYARDTKEYQALSVYSLIVLRHPIEGETVEVAEALAQRPDLLALAEIPLDRSQWLGLDEGNPDHRHQLAAWRERIKDWSGKWMELEDLPMLDAKGQQVVKFSEWRGEQIPFKQTYKGLAVPRRWPPRLDGSWPENQNFAQAG